jgi:hypothetical protein
MKFNKTELQIEFTNYYKETGFNATHIFVFSERQNEVIKNTICDGEKKQPYVNNEKYSEMRNRDSDDVFNWDDTKFIAVGTNNDIRFQPY